MINSLFSLLSGLFKSGSFWIYGACGACIVALGVYIRILSLENDKLEMNLKVSMSANAELNQAFESLKARHEAELKALSEVKQSEIKVQEKVKIVDKIIYKQIKQGENNLTKLFALMVDELYKEVK